MVKVWGEKVLSQKTSILDKVNAQLYIRTTRRLIRNIIISEKFFNKSLAYDDIVKIVEKILLEFNNRHKMLSYKVDEYDVTKIETYKDHIVAIIEEVKSNDSQ